MDKQLVTIRCFDACTFTLVWPDFFLSQSKTNVKKILKYLFTYSYYEANKTTIAFLDSAFPPLIGAIENEGIFKAEQAWQESSIKFQDGYLTTDSRFFPPMSAYQKSKERARRKAHNDKLMREVKSAKAEYERQKKHLARAKELYEYFTTLNR